MNASPAAQPPWLAEQVVSVKLSPSPEEQDSMFTSAWRHVFDVHKAASLIPRSGEAMISPPSILAISYPSS
jgi:hypothetical protein